MPTELEELVGFIAHPHPQIRQVAVENLVPYSTAEPNIFKDSQLQPVKNLKILIRDHPKISEHAVTILVNLSGDQEILENLATDEKFLDVVFRRIVNPEEPNANLLAMLLANLAKWDSFKDVLKRKQQAPEELGSDDVVLNQLMDLFVKGQDGSYNKKADFDYLAYVFADLAKHSDIRKHFLQAQKYDDVIPLTKLKVFTEHKSDIRRKGVASTIKNVAFETSSHASFLSEDEIDILPYILLPIMGNEEYDVDESMDMLPDLQLLPPDKKRDSDHKNIQTHVETLTLLTTTREGRDLMRRVKVYPVIRETHLRVEDEGVQEACERLVQVLARDEADEGKDESKDDVKLIEGTNGRVEEVEDEDDQLVEV
ncbi:Protein HGH1-like protein [Fusarium keratoplasticum]|uniref:Protein HGH1 homolog n=2 Tax=Fusarium solani species complex TaxID=232080 RepID=A0A9W8RAH5_9HYPO|nr:Protein HGH1-like protein [Fusarium keratoplasticum]KAI8679562.1 Protein HGH1-like protein [Fusarium keratoplasticum]KAI8685651.1 Protein HGH1-like protein [Fusarium keratoplasticum]KAJ4189622.1 Protein hgh1 [Fusarium falciforme]KAJ4209979.1 Protein hgh1 [Fusarium falciforme]